ncbi:MAG: SDR family oxidoreductase [Bradymonadia bacterium]
MKLTDAKVVVTGAASGMGRYFALSFAREGAKVAACDLNTEELATLVTEAEGLPGEIKAFECNVADEASVQGMMDAAFAAFGGINGLVNNAGIIRDGLLVKKDKNTGEIKTMSLKKWQQVIDVNLTGPFLCTREFAARVIEAGIDDSVVVNISSISRAGNRGQSNYSAAKAGLVADTVLWSKELVRYGMRFGAIAPGFVRTPILEGMPPAALERVLQGVPMKRLGEPEEIFAGVRFIFENGYFTGRVLEIDGGLIL